MLHPDTIDDVKQRMDIYDVVSEQVVLKKQGKDFAGLCPFHEEKTPSFTVSPSKQMFYCFGCGKGGNAITFLMETGQASFSDVVLDLAQRYNVPVRTLDRDKQDDFQRTLSRREQLHEILALAARFFQHALHQPQGETALQYLKQERGFSEETLQSFELGYAPEGWDTLYGYLVQQKDYPVELVEAVGLIIPRKRGSGHYDRFRNRVMIPIHDSRGRVIGFGGRSLGDEQPKYLNSPETELFDKGQTLFALDKARQTIAKVDRAVVVEGYFDAIALHAAGISEAVASLGTALSESQVKQLLRYSESKQVLFNFDADAAGTRAAERAIGEVANLAYRGMVQLRILQVPGGKDADEFLKTSSAEAYLQLIEQAPLWIDWQIQQIIGDRDLSQADVYQQVVRQLVDLLSQLQNSTSRTHYIHHCAQLLCQGDSRRVPLLEENLGVRLRRSLSRDKAKQHSKPSDRPPTPETQAPELEDIPEDHDEDADLQLPIDSDRALIEQAEALLLQAYLHCPDERSLIIAAIADLETRDIHFSLAPHRWLWQHLEALAPNPQDDAGVLFQKLQQHYPDESTILQQVTPLFQPSELAELAMQRTALAVRSATAAIERTICQKRYRRLLQLWQDTDPRDHPQQAREYQDQLYAEKRHMDHLDRTRQTHLTELVSLTLPPPS
ncbi:DNA primase [Sodalinema gerasimenkoae]|uniref:DNA primase n=1 Tax=Sodalinema gerasimenkoae TaxID=2862348 RepID=UPI0013595241|nr:DNA primase [Sodalinema gerasimenkoae]